MKRIFAVFLAAALFLAGCVAPLEAPAEAEPGDIAAAFVALIAGGAYDEAYEMLNADVTAAISEPAVLGEYWAIIVDFLGEYQETVAINESPSPDGVLRIFEVSALHGEPSLLSHTTVVFGADGKIAGFNLNILPNPHFQPETAASETAFTEEPVTVGENGEYPLPGLLAMPADADGPVPAAVIVHGSGPADMDGTVSFIKPYRDIAQYLAANGVAVLRYDKRTLAHGEKLAASPEAYARFTVYEESVEDALLAKELLAADPRVDAGRIYVIGHSLGGVLAPEIAALGDFAGFVILGGALTPLVELMAQQYEYLLKDEPPAAAEPFLAQIYEARELFYEALDKTDEENQNTFIMDVAAYYWVDLYRRGPAPYLLAWEKPGLILHGGMDYQCRANIEFTEYMRLTAGMGNITGVLYPNLTHLFTQSHSETGMGTAADYMYPERVDEAVLAAIAEFILER